jgi:hypothetical protein
VLASRADVEPVFGQARGLRRRPRGAECRAAELDGALGEVVGVLEQLVHDGIEKLVERDEVRALDVPVRPLGLERKIEGIGELLVQELDRARAYLFWEVVLRVPQWSIHAFLSLCRIS